MPRNSCSIDGVVQHSKMASVYWAWTWPTGDRRSFKQLRCVQHSVALAEMCARAKANVQDCTACGEEFSDIDTPVTVWATVYFPHRERIDAWADFHARCFEAAEPAFRLGATRLPDRKGPGRGAPRPGHEDDDPWRAIGIPPSMP